MNGKYWKKYCDEDYYHEITEENARFHLAAWYKDAEIALELLRTDNVGLRTPSAYYRYSENQPD